MTLAAVQHVVSWPASQLFAVRELRKNGHVDRVAQNTFLQNYYWQETKSIGKYVAIPFFTVASFARVMNHFSQLRLPPDLGLAVFASIGTAVVVYKIILIIADLFCTNPQDLALEAQKTLEYDEGTALAILQ